MAEPIHATFEDWRKIFRGSDERAAWDARQPEIDLLRERASEADQNGEAIMLMREHLSRVGINAAFADDVAARAAATITDLRERLAGAEKGRDVAIANRDALGKSWHEIAQAIGGIPLHDCPKDIEPCPECQKTLADLVMERLARNESA